jgi:hypothetical protein
LVWMEGGHFFLDEWAGGVIFSWWLVCHFFWGGWVSACQFCLREAHTTKNFLLVFGWAGVCVCVCVCVCVILFFGCPEICKF